MTWLTDTLVSTGLLIALVLLARRPVTRLFGPGLAYALWALPVLRLLLPPLVLPAPPVVPRVDPVPVAVETMPEVSVVAAAAPAWTWSAWVQAAWLAGVMAFLGWRTWQYLAMRRRLLAGSHEVGRAGEVRLVEGPAVASPVAFGVIDKVVALPPGFMARADLAGRDLALRHELEHHAGRDLAVNIAVQPLLALHWFNPLAWIGWRALRRDQEAACDARVLAGCSPATREIYGRLIASLAKGPQPALAAPLACAVIGEKSIVHRLRSLTMNEPSPRRRLAGRALILAAAAALPLSATISYAASDAPAAPAAPQAPAAPDAPKVVKSVKKIVIVDKEGGADPSDPALVTKVIERDGKTIVFKSDKELSEAEIEARIAKAEQSMAEAEGQVIAIETDGPDSGDGKHGRVIHSRNVTIVRAPDGHDHGEKASHTKLALACSGSGEAIAIAEEGQSKGKREAVQLRWCSAGEASADHRKHALEAMKQAREEMGKNNELSDETRRKVLEKLDAKIAELSSQG